MVHAVLCKYVFRAADSSTHTNCSAQNAAPPQWRFVLSLSQPLPHNDIRFVFGKFTDHQDLNRIVHPQRVCQLCRCSVKSENPKWRSVRKIPKTYLPSTSNTTRWLGLHRRASTKCFQRRLVNSPAAAVVARGSVLLQTHEVAHTPLDPDADMDARTTLSMLAQSWHTPPDADADMDARTTFKYAGTML